jgi:serine protease Do
MGNPLGELRGSVTVGIVSAQGRSNLNIYGGTPSYQDFIQTDASINFGNSGGPLVNIRGEAIGINTAVNTSGQGIGFAIPINLVRHVAEQLISSGEVKRAWIGVTLAELTPEIADGFGIKDRQGVVISDVLKDQPAERAGLRRGDVVVEMNGQPVSDLPKFRFKVADTPVGSKLNLVVLRDGKRVPVTVTLSPRPADLASFRGGSGNQDAPHADSPSGVSVRALSTRELENGGIKSGVMITDVAEGSAAEEAGLQPSDLIEEVNGKPVGSPSEFAQAIAEAKKANKRHAVLLVHRQGNTSFIPVKIAE